MSDTHTLAPPGAAIVVVTGHPRSGTSLMMQMLEAAGVSILRDNDRPGDVSNPNGYYELAAVKSTARDSTWVDGAPGHAVKVIHALLPHLPRDRSYRVILMQRDLREVIESQARMLDGRSDARSDPGADASRDLPDARLEEIYAAQLDETRELLDREPCFEWIEVRHADLIAGDRETTLAIRRLLNLSARDEAMREAIDPTLYRSRAAASISEPEA